ncbi:MAG: hypothetical protein ACLUHA_17250 [Bacteroides stercoris]
MSQVWHQAIDEQGIIFNQFFIAIDKAIFCQFSALATGLVPLGERDKYLLNVGERRHRPPPITDIIWLPTLRLHPPHHKNREYNVLGSWESESFSSFTFFSTLRSRIPSGKSASCALSSFTFSIIIMIIIDVYPKNEEVLEIVGFIGLAFKMLNIRNDCIYFYWLDLLFFISMLLVFASENSST